MNKEQKHCSTETDAELTLVELDELRRTLGAEADMAAAPTAAARPTSTIMCPSHPWDQ